MKLNPIEGSPEPESSLEEQARELLARAGIKGVSTLTSGDLVEIANLIRVARVVSSKMADIDSLRAFALAVLEDWPEGAPDGFDLQDLAVKHGLLVVKDPKCYVRSPLLLGTDGVSGSGGYEHAGARPTAEELDAAIAAVLNATTGVRTPDPFIEHFAKEEATQPHSYDAGGVRPVDGGQHG